MRGSIALSVSVFVLPSGMGSAFLITPAEHSSQGLYRLQISAGPDSAGIISQLQHALSEVRDSTGSRAEGAGLPLASAEADDSVSLLKKAARLFAGAHSQNDGLASVPEQLGEDVRAGPSTAKAGDVGFATRRAPDAVGCQPDFDACPRGWSPIGALCMPAADITGAACESPVDLSGMTEGQKVALARYCKTDFPCVKNCTIDAEAPCPSMWREVASGVCEAHSGYSGPCQGWLDARNMTGREKASFGVACSAWWPCASRDARDYAAVCPEGWSLQSAQTCDAPIGYAGPCGVFLDMRGADVAEKKQIEAFCGTSWRSIGRECARNYDASCPFGWLALPSRDGFECRAPPGYGTCASAQSFFRMSPEEKRQWEALCGQRFPCKSRSSCETDWSVPCPADWFSVAGDCAAPVGYRGACSSVLREAGRLTVAERQLTAERCETEWPCFGETAAALEFARRSLPRLPGLSGGALSASGPVDGRSGTVARGRRVPSA